MFFIFQDDYNTSPQLDYAAATANESYVPGELLKIASGKVTKAAGTDAPVYLSNGVLSNAKDGDQLQVIRLHRNHKLKTTLSAAGTSLVVGNKVTIGTDGLQATATTTGGVLEIVDIIDSAAGGEVIVRVATADEEGDT